MGTVWLVRAISDSTRFERLNLCDSHRLVPRVRRRQHGQPVLPDLGEQQGQRVLACAAPKAAAWDAECDVCGSWCVSSIFRAPLSSISVRQTNEYVANTDRDGTIDMMFVTCDTVSSSTGVGTGCKINIAYNRQVPTCSSATQKRTKDGKLACRAPEDLCIADPDFRFNLSEGDNPVRHSFRSVKNDGVGRS